MNGNVKISSSGAWAIAGEKHKMDKQNSMAYLFSPRGYPVYEPN
jgi:hypothetical protein